MAHNRHQHFHLHKHQPIRAPASITAAQPAKRSSDSGGKCSPGKPNCAYPTDNSATLPIVLGVLIPLGCAFVAILYLTRRNRLRQKREDAEYKHASLDFGLGEVHRAKGQNQKQKRKKGKKDPESVVMDLEAERAFRQNRGMSMDMGSPYVLASELEESRPSFQSLSRSAQDADDPYRPINLVRSESANGIYSSRPPSRNASMFTQSSEGTGRGNLLRNPSSPSSNTPPEESLSPALLSPGPSPLLDVPPSAQAVPARKPVATDAQPEIESKNDTEATEAGISEQPPQLTLHQLPPPRISSHSANLQSDFDSTDDNHAIEHKESFPTIEVTPTQPEDGYPPPNGQGIPNIFIKDDPLPPTPPAENNRAVSLGPYDEYETYADVLGIVQKESSIPYEDMTEEEQQQHQQMQQMQGLGVHGFEYDNRRLSASIRPLPPDDITDNPETRANRIRSFYREYFDESNKRDTAMGWGLGGGGVDYYEDYGQEYLNGATIFDPETGQFIVAPNAPFAQPVTRRAMTPPPRAPPRYGGSAGSHRYFGSAEFGPGGHRARGYSASGPDLHGRAARKKLAPPKPLTNLPTPYLLKNDAAIFGATDFAPPSSARDRAAGRPQTPFAEQRPYSPSVRAYTPLASPFADLTAMPSPHHLRKSGTFTALDFAPPPRLKMGDGASDAGSIRSGRSNMSASQLANIRAGAYRVSRIPKNYVGTVDDMSKSLRPTWDLRGPTPGLSS